MEQIEKLAYDGTLVEFFMSDSKRVQEAKEELKKDNIEISDEQLRNVFVKMEEIFNKTAQQYSSKEKLNHEEINTIVGGIKKDTVISLASACVGAYVGGYTGRRDGFGNEIISYKGLEIGAKTGYNFAQWVFKKTKENKR